MNEANHAAWLLTPTGILVSRVVQTVLKCGLVWLSAKVPALGLGPQIDSLVQQLAPVAAVALCVAWTKWQHDRAELIKKTAVNTAVIQTAQQVLEAVANKAAGPVLPGGGSSISGLR